MLIERINLMTNLRYINVDIMPELKFLILYVQKYKIKNAKNFSEIVFRYLKLQLYLYLLLESSDLLIGLKLNFLSNLT